MPKIVTNEETIPEFPCKEECLLPLADLCDFPDQPYLLTDMNSLEASIKEHGVREPISVYPKNGKYIIISGHRRVAACRNLGATSIRAIIWNINDDEAKIMLVDSNVHRTQLDRLTLIRLSKYLYDEVLPIVKSVEKLAAYFPRRRDMLERYHRIATNLAETWQQSFIAPGSKFAFMTAHAISFLQPIEQQRLLFAVEKRDGILPRLTQAKALKKASMEKRKKTTATGEIPALREIDITQILVDVAVEKIDKRGYTLSKELVDPYMPKSCRTDEAKRARIIQCLKKVYEEEDNKSK